MKWLFNKCWRYEVSLSLLAAGALPVDERAGVEEHVAACAACRAKLAELQILSRGLVEAGQRLPQLEASASLRRRWVSAVRESATKESKRRGFTAPEVGVAASSALGSARPPVNVISSWFSGRRLAWGSLAAMWGLILFFRFSTPEASKPPLLSSAPPVSLREVLLALKVEDSPKLVRADTGKRPSQEKPPPDALPPRSQVAPVRSTDLEVA